MATIFAKNTHKIFLRYWLPLLQGELSRSDWGDKLTKTQSLRLPSAATSLYTREALSHRPFPRKRINQNQLPYSPEGGSSKRGKPQFPPSLVVSIRVVQRRGRIRNLPLLCGSLATFCPYRKWHWTHWKVPLSLSRCVNLLGLSYFLWRHRKYAKKPIKRGKIAYSSPS